MNKIVEKIGDYEFVVTTKRSADGSLLWNEEIQKKYNSWLLELYSKNKDVFTIQKINIPQPVMDVINQLIQENPGCDRSDVIRAMVRVYIDRIDNKNALSKAIEGAFGAADFQKALSEPFGTEVVKVRFMPKAFVSLRAYGDLFDLKPKEVVEHMIYRVAACFHQYDWIAAETNNYLAA